MDEDTLRQLAEIGHRCWRQRMLDAGWKPGRAYDEAAMTHDALVDFDQLRRSDRRAAESAIEVEGILGHLTRAVAPDRSSTRLFDAEELASLPQVGWAPGVKLGAAEGGRCDEQGQVDSWELDEAGDVTLIRVRWSGRAELTAHNPFLRDLRRLDE